MRPALAIALSLAAFAAGATPSLAAGIELPPRKPGLWEMRIQVETAAMPPQIIRMCLDEKTDKAVNEKFGGMAASICSKQEQKTDGAAIVIDSECAIGEMKAVSHSVITGDFQSAYKMRTDVKLSGNAMTGTMRRLAPEAQGGQTTVIDATHAGACPAERKPGDIDFGDGRIVNVQDVPVPQMQ